MFEIINNTDKKMCKVHCIYSFSPVVEDEEGYNFLTNPVKETEKGKPYTTNIKFNTNASSNCTRSEFNVAVIMGDGTGRRNFVKIAQELGISHRVHFTGMISNLDVHQNLINSAMHVVPSLAEPFGITAIESMLDGTPVIASNSGGLKESVEDEKTGLLVSPGDVDMLASAILRLWQHPELRKKLAGASIEKARNVYTWENVSAFTRNVYTQAIANGNGC